MRARKWHYQWRSQRSSYSRIEVVIHVLKHASVNSLFNRHSLLSNPILYRSDSHLAISYDMCRYFMLMHTGYFYPSFFFLPGDLREQWVEMENIVSMYLIRRWLVVVWWGRLQSICVGVRARLHLCACVVLGANDSWHLATISGLLISIERFGGKTHSPLSLRQMCVWSAYPAHTHTDTQTFTHTHRPSRAEIWHMEMSTSERLLAYWYWQN